MQRLSLRVSPLDVAASGVRGQAETEEIVSIKNVADAPIVVMRMGLAGEGARVFKLEGAPAVSRTLMPGQGLDVVLRFAPPADAAPGVHRCTLQVYIGPDDDLGPIVDIAGLVTQGESAVQEPPLAQVVAALGYGVDVGGEALALPASEAPIGAEIGAALFKRAKPGAIAVDPVARYSWEGPAPYGLFRLAAGRPTLESLGELAADQHQRLHPAWTDEGRLSFDPGEGAFGLYVQTPKAPLFTADRLNPAPHPHAARVYPLRSRNGAAIPDAYLVAFEHAAPTDFQDFVFVIWNVVPAPE